MPFVKGRPQGGKCADPQFRTDRARRAARAARIARRARAVKAAEKYGCKAEAYATGYRVGYNAAYRLWKWRAARDRQMVLDG